MATSDVIDLITDLKPQFFRGLIAPELHEVVSAADYRRFAADSVILNQGHRANAVLLLVRGQARTTFTTNGGQRLLLRWLPTGEVFGLAALLPTAKDYILSTEAVKESWGLVWDRTTIRKLALRHPAIWENAFTIVSEALAGYLAVHVSQTRHAAKQRLARTLVDLASAIGSRTSAGVEVGVRNEDLANAANVTQFTASRVLNQWQRDGSLIKTRGKVVLRSLESLLLHEV
jgi:CRP-like cAMP-binding protein